MLRRLARNPPLTPGACMRAFQLALAARAALPIPVATSPPRWL